jgi:hypothetical protein
MAGASSGNVQTSDSSNKKMFYHGPKRSELLFNIPEDIGQNERPMQHLVKTSSKHEAK